MADLAQYQQDFLTRYAPYANLASQQLGLPSRVILAKLAVETGWGQHFANNNLPGLKTGNAGQNDGFGSAQTATWEDYGGGARTNIKDGFIKYPTPEQSIGGLVPWLSNSTYMNSLADRKGGGILDIDPAAEKSAVEALGKSGFSTDSAASAKVARVLDQMPSLSSYGIAPSFSPASALLMNIVPYNGATDKPNVSEGLGGFSDNYYSTGTEYQPGGGVVLPREKGANGLELPGPTIGGPMAGQAGQGAVGQFSDAITQALEGFGRGVARVPTQIGNAVSDALSGFTPSGPAPGVTDFSGVDVSGGVGNGSLNPVLSPFQPAPGATDFSGTNVSVNVQPGTINPGLIPGDTAFSGRFDPSAYLAANADVAADAGARANPWQHYLQYGLNEGRAIDARGDRFDPSKYASQNADVVAAGWDPAQHYAQFGATEGRAAPIIGPDGTVQLAQNFAQGLTIGPQQANTIAPTQVGTAGPSGIFDAAAYLRNNPDLAAARVDPVEHFLRFGADEGRIIDDNGDRFDAKTYGAQNADVLAAGMDPLLHYVKFGAAEGRQAPIIGPDGTVRMVSNLGIGSPIASDLAGQLLQAEEVQRRGDPQAGLTIGPGPTAPTIGAGPAVQPVGAGQAFRGLDPTEYVKANADLAADAGASADPIGHFLRFGQAENRPLTLDGQRFDGAAYLAANPDVARAGMSPLEHYLEFGGKEWRQAQTIGPDGTTHTIGPDFFAPGVQAPSAQTIQAILHPTIGAPPVTPTIGPPALTPTIGAGPAVQATSPSLNVGAYDFSNANVGGALGASPQSFGSFHGTSNLGMDMGQPQAQTGGIGQFGFSNANVGGFDVNGFGGSSQASGGEAYGPPTYSSNFNPQSSQNAYLDSQVNFANQQNAALDAFNPAIRNGMLTSSTGDPGIYKAAADYNVATLAANQANLAKPRAPAAAPVNVPRVAQGAFAPAPFVGRW